MVAGRNMNAKQRYRKKIREYSEYGIIYKATLLIDGRIYIGQTTRSLKERISEHSHKGLFYFNNVIAKYGIDNFKWEIIDKANYQKELDEKESYCISLYKSNIKEFGFNLTSGGDHGVYSEEVRKKMSENMVGVKNHRYGKKHSPETRLRRSIALKGLTSGSKHCMYGKPSHNCKRVRCIETSESFDSVKLASINKNIGPSNLSNCLTGRNNTAGGYHWEVV